MKQSLPKAIVPETIHSPEERIAAVRAGVVDYLPNMLAFARSLAPNRHQADDLVHDTVVRALAAAQTFTPGTNLRGWLLTILRNQFFNEFRKPWTRRVSLSDFTMDKLVVEPNQDRSLEMCDFRRAFLQLVPEHREALILIGAADTSYEEAAKICGCAVGTVKSRVSRARSMLKTLMNGDHLKLPRRAVAPTAQTDLGVMLKIPAPAIPTAAH